MPRNPEPRRAQFESPDSHTPRSYSASLLCLSLTAVLGVPALLFAFSPLQDSPASEVEKSTPAGTEPAPVIEPSQGVTDSEIKELVEDLADPSYRVRRQALSRLHSIGKPALEALTAGSESKDPEVRERCIELIEMIKSADQKKVPSPTEAGRDSILEEFEKRFGGFNRPRRRGFPFGDFEEQMRRLDEQIREMEAQMRGSGKGGLPDPKFGPPIGTGWSGSSRVEIWENGEKVFDSESSSGQALDRTFGVLLELPTAALRAHLPIPDGEGLLVTEVLEESAAQKAGLMQFDIILAAGSNPMTGFGQLRKELDFSGAKPTSLQLIRKGQPLTIEVRIPKQRF